MINQMYYLKAYSYQQFSVQYYALNFIEKTFVNIFIL